RALDVEVDVVDVVLADDALVRRGQRGRAGARLGQFRAGRAAEGDDGPGALALRAGDLGVGGRAVDRLRVAPDRGSAAADDECRGVAAHTRLGDGGVQQRLAGVGHVHVRRDAVRGRGTGRGRGE